MSHYPADIEKFHSTLLQLKGITEVQSGVEDLEPISAELLGSSGFAHLPLAALLRTNGGLENEVLIQFELCTDYSPESLHSLEFLAWFVRDCARGGTRIQLRPFALPPSTPFGRQIGTTLKFHIDLFVDGIGESLEPAFEVIRRLQQSLQTAIKLYEIPQK